MTKKTKALVIGGVVYEMKGEPLTFADLTPEQKAELKGDPLTWDDLTEEQKAELKGEKGDSAVYNPEDPDTPDFVMANGLGDSTTKAMTQMAITRELRPVRRILDDFEWVDKGMHPATPSTLGNWAGMQTSLAYPIRKGDKVVVETSNNGTNTFTAIAYLTEKDQQSGWTKIEACNDRDQQRHLYTWVADADGYVRVCGYKTDMDACIEVGNALATQAGLDAANGKIADLERANNGRLEDWAWNVGLLHGADGLPSTSGNNYAKFRYSDEVLLHKGDKVVVKTYFQPTGSETIIASKYDGTTTRIAYAGEAGDARGTWLTKTYVVEKDGELIRVCGLVSWENEEYEITAYVEMASANAKKSDIAEIKEAMKGGTLPDYWKAYLDERIEQTEEMLEEGDDAFVFVTDVHYGDNVGNSTSVIRHIVDNSRIAKVFCGGDICKTGAGTSTYEKLIVQEVRGIERLAEAVSDNGKFYPAMGNHDYFEYTGGTKYSYPKRDSIRHMKGLAYPLGTSMADDDDGLYYFFDNMEARVRYIVVDCMHGDGYTLKTGATQAQWLADAIAATPSGYGIVVTGHCPASPRMSPSAETTADKLAIIRSIIVAAANKQAGTIAFTDTETTTAVDIGYDFTSLDADVLMYLCGHTHIDNQAFHDGIPFVACICDKRGQYAYSPFCEGTSLAVTNKPLNTVGEQAISVVTIPAGHDIISVLRYGSGFDRHFHVGMQTVPAGGTLNLALLVQKITPSTWGICDCDGVAYTNDAWNYSTAKAAISNGVVTGVAAGEAMAFAEDEEHNKEFFHLRIEG